MNILIAGGSGLVGSELKSFLSKEGHQVDVLTRSAMNHAKRQWHWDPSKKEMDSDALQGQDVVINLAGARVLPKPWTKKRRKELTDSRVISTAFLTAEINKQARKPKKYIQISAIGFYGDRGDELLDEDSPAGEGFLPELCLKWEEACSSLDPEVKKHILRLGLYMHQKGGYYPINALLTKLKLLTSFGNGKQYFAFSHKNQLNKVTQHLLTQNESVELYNVVSKSAYRSSEFVRQIGALSFIPNIPKWLLKLVLPRTSEAFLSSTNVVSKHELIHACDEFKDLDEMLSSLAEESK